MDHDAPLEVYFDDRCPVCQSAVQHWTRQDDKHQLVFESCRSAESHKRLGDYAGAALDQIHVTQGDTVYAGVAALIEIYRRLPKMTFWVWVLRMARALGVAEPVYRWFAKNRMLFRREGGV